MNVEWIIQQVQNRGNELLKTFAHEPNYSPRFDIDARTHQAKLVVKYADRQAERVISTQLVCNAPKKQASDSLALVYQECLKELMK
jgi:hypothetical protein